MLNTLRYATTACRDLKADREKTAVAGMLTLYQKVSICKCQFIV